MRQALCAYLCLLVFTYIRFDSPMYVFVDELCICVRISFFAGNSTQIPKVLDGYICINEYRIKANSRVIVASTKHSSDRGGRDVLFKKGNIFIMPFHCTKTVFLFSVTRILYKLISI